MKRKIIRWQLVCALGVSAALAFSGCGEEEKDKEKVTEEEQEETADYNYEFRDLKAPVYREAAEQFSGGDGSENSPYQIGSAEELQLMANLLNDEKTADEYKDKAFVLTADIALNDTENYISWNTERPEYDWEPMGRTTDEFEGVLNGDGHTIRGLYINTDHTTKNDVVTNHYGLFGSLQGTVQNLSIDESYVEVAGYSTETGILAGDMYQGIVQNCTVNGKVIGYDGTYGGVTGLNSSGKILDTQFGGTLSAAKEGSSSKLGGIAGYVTGQEGIEGQIQNCMNVGELSIPYNYASAAGGIAGVIGEGGQVEFCSNEGLVNGLVKEGAGDDSVCVSVGGIAGRMGVVSATDEKEDAVLRNSQNHGEVQGGEFAGGIVGSVNSATDKHEIEISGCSNTGNVTSPEGLTAGIVADVSNKNAGIIRILDCINEENFEQKCAAGIVNQLVQTNGTVEVKNCMNQGMITNDDLYAGGIIRYAANLEGGWNLIVENCRNTGDLFASKVVGGVVGFTNYNVENAEPTTFTVTGCENTGTLSSSTHNGYIGGIIGQEGFLYTAATISDCTNSGNIMFTEPFVVDQETKESEEKITFSVNAGGIIGDIGLSLSLSIDGDETDAAAINVDDGMVKLVNCTSTGLLTSSGIQNGEDFLDYWEENLGGLIGTCSTANGTTLTVQNCTYKNASRGMGREVLPDVGRRTW